MLMSATSADEGAIQISDSDLNSAILGARLRASKTLQLVDTDRPIIPHMTNIAQADPPQRTIVYVRSPKDAVTIAESLKKKHKNVVTLTGTMRGKERDELVDNPAREPASPKTHKP